MKAAGAAPFTLRVESVGQAAAAMGPVVGVPGGELGVPVEVAVDAGPAVPAGLVEVCEADVPVGLLFALPGVLPGFATVPGVFDVFAVPTVCPPP